LFFLYRELYVERIEKKADALAQIARQLDEKNVSSSSIPSSSKSTDEDPPPNDLLCPLCKRVYADAVITPCCNLSFCDECKINKEFSNLLIIIFFKGIRTALVESHEHECPSCHCQHVAIDQINPNLYLRNHIRRWHERQNQSSYSHLSMPQQTLDQDFDTTSTTNLPNSNDVEEYDPTVVSINSHQGAPSIKAPIVIKMQPRGKSPSPQPIVSTRPADLTFEDEKALDSDQITSRYVYSSYQRKSFFFIYFSQKDSKTTEETTDTFPSSTTTESKFEIFFLFLNN